MAATLPGTNPELLAPSADADRDGLSNLIEVAFASDPGAGGSSPISFAISEDGRLEIGYRRPHLTFEGTLYVLETSTDLVTWLPIPESEFSTEREPLPDGTLAISHVIPTPNSGRQHYRIRVEM